MSESKQRWIALSKLLVVVVFAFLYALGGEQLGDTGHKWIRRYLASGLLVGSMWFYSRDPRTLIQYPLMVLTLSMGYGADSFFAKVMRRGVWGLANGLSFNFHSLLTKNWTPILLGMLVSMIVLIDYGVFNFTPSARMEEMAIGAFLALVPLSAIKEKQNG